MPLTKPDAHSYASGNHETGLAATNLRRWIERVTPVLKHSRLPQVTATACALFLGLLFLMVLLSPSRLVYDEREYIHYPRLLMQHGFGSGYLRSLTGSAGPLYGVIHAIFSPLTHLQPPYIRLISLFSFFATLGITFRTTTPARALTAGMRMESPASATVISICASR